MKIKCNKVAVFLILSLLIVFLSHCNKDDNNISDVGPEVNPAVKVVSEDDENKIQYVSTIADTIIFNGVVSDFQVNDIIVSQKDEGILRKVSSVVQKDGSTELITSPVSIAEAFPNAEFSCDIDLTPSNVDEIKYYTKGISLNNVESGFNFDLKDVVLWDKDGNPLTENDQVNADGKLVLKLNPYLKVKNLNSEARSITVGCNPVGIIEISVDCPFKVDWLEPEPKLLMTIKTKPQTIFIGGVPVIITNEIPIYMGIKGKAEAKLTSGIKNTTTLHAELKWENGNPSFNKSFDNKFELLLPSISSEVDLQAYLTPALNIKLYGVAGPSIDLKGYLKGIASVEAGIGGWTLSAAIYGGIELSIGLILKIFDFRLTSIKSPPIISYEYKIKEWTSVTDVDGNEYNTVTIGTQLWMKENLKVSRYNNGDLINTTNFPTADISGESTPRYQWAYAGVESNVSSYGRLYTWYAINDNRNICPVGWHVPTDPDWEKLALYISDHNGGYSKQEDDWFYVGGKLKSKAGWNNGGNGTDSYDFSALPAGGRAIDGLFVNLGDQSIWWSKTEYTGGATNSYVRIIANSSTGFIRHYYNKSSGFSIRCVRN